MACVKAALCAPRSGREPWREPHPGYAVRRGDRF